ncbi:hypothetical protein ACRRTK_009316 [Alexandromys fortis]
MPAGCPQHKADEEEEEGGDATTITLVQKEGHRFFSGPKSGSSETHTFSIPLGPGKSETNSHFCVTERDSDPTICSVPRNYRKELGPSKWPNGKYGGPMTSVTGIVFLPCYGAPADIDNGFQKKMDSDLPTIQEAHCESDCSTSNLVHSYIMKPTSAAWDNPGPLNNRLHPPVPTQNLAGEVFTDP